MCCSVFVHRVREIWQSAYEHTHRQTHEMKQQYLRVRVLGTVLRERAVGSLVVLLSRRWRHRGAPLDRLTCHGYRCRYSCSWRRRCRRWRRWRRGRWRILNLSRYTRIHLHTHLSYPSLSHNSVESNLSDICNYTSRALILGTRLSREPKNFVMTIIIKVKGFFERSRVLIYETLWRW